MNVKTAWIIMMVLYGLDCLLITPYILWKGLGQEVGLLMSWGYESFGFGWFPFWFIIFSVVMLVVLKYSFIFLDWKLGDLSKYPKFTLVLTWSILTILQIINNLRFV